MVVIRCFINAMAPASLLCAVTCATPHGLVDQTIHAALSDTVNHKQPDMQAADFMGDDVVLGEVARRYATELAQLPVSAQLLESTPTAPGVGGASSDAEVYSSVPAAAHLIPDSRTPRQHTFRSTIPTQQLHATTVSMLQVVKRASPNVVRRILLEAPVSLLRLLALLPPALHTLAIESRTRIDADPGDRTLTLADAKDLPPAGVANALGAFALHANSLQGLRSLVMTHIAGSHQASASTLARFLPLLTALTSLNISHSALSAPSRGAVVRAAAGLHSLAALDLSGIALGINGIKALSELRTDASALTALSLANSALGSAGLELLPTALERMPALQRLDVRANNGDADGAIEMYGDGALLWPAPAQLCDLCLSDSDIPLDTILPLLATLTRLQQTEHRQAHAHVQWAALQGGTQLRELRLVDQVTFVPHAPHGLTALTALALQVSPVNPDAWLINAAEALTSLTRLADLSLTGEDPSGVDVVPLDPETVQALAACISAPARLTRLELSATTDLEGGHDRALLLEQVARHTSLQSLTLGMLGALRPLAAEWRSAFANLTDLCFTDPTESRGAHFANLKSWVTAAPGLQQLSVGYRLHFAEGSLHNMSLASTLTTAALQLAEEEGQIRPLMLRAVLASMPALRYLELHGLHFGRHEADVVWRAVSQCSLLTHLHLQHGGQLAAEECVTAAALHLPLLAHLREVSLFGFACHVPTNPSAARSSMESALLSLTALRKLAMVAVTPVGLPQLALALSRGLLRLHELKLRLRELVAGGSGQYHPPVQAPAWSDALRCEEVEAGFTIDHLASQYGVAMLWQ